MYLLRRLGVPLVTMKLMNGLKFRFLYQFNTIYSHIAHTKYTVSSNGYTARVYRHQTQNLMT